MGGLFLLEEPPLLPILFVVDHTKHEPTVAFSVSRYLMMVEGPSSTLGLLIARLYENPQLPRTEWSVSHTAPNRPAFVRQLHAAGAANRRIGVSVHTQGAVDTITQAAKTLRLNARCLTTHPDFPGGK